MMNTKITKIIFNQKGMMAQLIMGFVIATMTFLSIKIASIDKTQAHKENEREFSMQAIEKRFSALRNHCSYRFAGNVSYNFEGPGEDSNENETDPRNLSDKLIRRAAHFGDTQTYTDNQNPSNPLVPLLPDENESEPKVLFPTYLKGTTTRVADENLTISDYMGERINFIQCFKNQAIDVMTAGELKRCILSIGLVGSTGDIYLRRLLINILFKDVPDDSGRVEIHSCYVPGSENIAERFNEVNLDDQAFDDVNELGQLIMDFTDACTATTTVNAQGQLTETYPVGSALCDSNVAGSPPTTGSSEGGPFTLFEQHMSLTEAGFSDGGTTPHGGGGSGGDGASFQF